MLSVPGVEYSLVKFLFVECHVNCPSPHKGRNALIAG